MAGFDWFKAYADMPGHPKSVRLGRAVRNPLAFGYVIRLWSFCAVYQQDGRFTGEDADSMLELTACEWTGTPGVLLAALLACGGPDVPGYVERIEGGYYVHDWVEVNGAHLAKKERDARKIKEKRSSVARQSRDGRANVAKESRERRGVEGEGEREEKQLLPDALRAPVAGTTQSLFLMAPVGDGAPAPAPEAVETTAPKPKRSTASETDPRFPALKAVWFEEYQRRYGAPYDSWGPADAVALHKRIAVPPDVFREKARRGLAVTGYGHTATCAELCSSKLWARLAGVGAPQVNGKPRRTMADVGEWNDPEKANETL